MFSVLSRSVARRSVYSGARWMSQVPPKGPQQPPSQQPPSSGEAGGEPQTSEPLGSTSQEAESSRRSNVPTLDFSPEPAEEAPQRTGAKSSRDSLSSSEQKRRKSSRVMMALMGLGLVGGAIHLGREWEEGELQEKRVKPEDAPQDRLGRTVYRFTEIFDYFSKPAWPELLPPPYPPPHQKPYTLLLSLDDLLITSTWDRNHGWRTAKRPGVDYFLGYLSQFYEIVIFTTQPSYTAEPILAKLDKYGFFITYRLYREATRSVNGAPVKDLSYLNRDLSKVVELDTNPDHIGNPDNAVVIPKWKGDPNDRGLVAMIPFLESIAIYKPQDVRPIINAYHGKNIPIEYAKKEAEMKEKHVAEWKAKHKSVGGASIGGLFGISSTPGQSRNEPPPTYLEQKRREAQRQYLDEQEYLRTHKDEFDRIIEQDQQAMMAQSPGNLLGVFGQLSGAKLAEAPLPPIPGQSPGAAGAATSLNASERK